MFAEVPRHLNKRPLIAGLEPVELLAVAALLIASNIICKSFGVSGLIPALVALTAFGFLKFYKKGKAPGHFIYLLKFHLTNKTRDGFRTGGAR